MFTSKIFPNQFKKVNKRLDNRIKMCSFKTNETIEQYSSSPRYDLWNKSLKIRACLRNHAEVYYAKLNWENLFNKNSDKIAGLRQSHNRPTDRQWHRGHSPIVSVTLHLRTIWIGNKCDKIRWKTNISCRRI